MKNDYGLDISYRVAWLGVEKARGEVYRDHAMSFDQLRWYSDSVMEKNPNSYINLEFDQQTGRGQRYGEMWSSAVESFNNWIWEARHLPIARFVDMVRGQIMKQMAERRVKARGWTGVLCPKMEKKLVTVYNDSRGWSVSQGDDNVYEVHSQPSILVDMARRSCSCFQWQLNGFSCSHAVVAFCNSGRNIYDSIETYYRFDEFKASYSGTIFPIPIVEKPAFTPNDFMIAPSKVKRPPGRPKRKRILSKAVFLPILPSSIDCLQRFTNAEYS
ncbi:hypothetical protein ACSBR2_004698 [Camellia fascicularis]